MLCRLLGIPELDSSQMVVWGDQMISNADPEYTPVIIDKMDTEEYRLLPFSHRPPWRSTDTPRR